MQQAVIACETGTHEHEWSEVGLWKRPDIATAELEAAWAIQVVRVCCLRLVDVALGTLDNKV